MGDIDEGDSVYAIEIAMQATVISDIDLRTSEAGRPWCSFRVAANERIQNRITGEWSDGESTYLTVKCWGRLAENVAASVEKGQPVVINGRLNQRHYERETDGRHVRGSTLEVSARAIGHDLSKGAASFQRTKSGAVQRAEGRALAEATAGMVDATPPPF